MNMTVFINICAVIQINEIVFQGRQMKENGGRKNHDPADHQQQAE
ncbi:MAG: hypothetical protein BWY71_02374 [Planctomycetes bacterium ADurb.Bin412]|nr:MAG: hypothetical protein BWY71_02374 [Planctomycetes bacterium ADurb.Bin412]